MMGPVIDNIKFTWWWITSPQARLPVLRIEVRDGSVVVTIPTATLVLVTNYDDVINTWWRHYLCNVQ